MKEKHANVSLFVPFEGCPHRCSFCNQNIITGKSSPLKVSDIGEAVRIANHSGIDASRSDIAFFGGSFTAIERAYMLSLLEEAARLCDEFGFRGIRVSTRPDCIDSEILMLLKKHRVTSIELGAQSMRDSVLLKNNRGHTALDTENALRLIKECGFETGLQMMTGLYGDDDEGAVYTAEKFIALKCDTVRIYPTIVLKGTYLYELFKCGKYTPQSLECAVSLCAQLLLKFHCANIRVIRAGLHASDNLCGDTLEDSSGEYIAGAYHPAFRELCESEIYLGIAKKEIQKQGISGKITIWVNESEISKMIGQKRKNIHLLKEIGITPEIKPDSKLKKYEITVQ